MNQQESGLFKSPVHRAASRVRRCRCDLRRPPAGWRPPEFLLVEDPQLLEPLNPSDRQIVVTTNDTHLFAREGTSPPPKEFTP